MGREWELSPYYSKEIGNKIKQHVSCKEFLYQTWHTWPGVACIGSGMGGGIKCVSSCCASWGLVYHRSGSKWRRGSLVQVRLQTGREPLLCMCSGPFENRKMNWSLTKNWDAQKRVCRNAAMDSETYWIAKGWLGATSETGQSKKVLFRWYTPEPGEININFDGGVSDGIAACAFVIRQHLRAMLCAGLHSGKLAKRDWSWATGALRGSKAMGSRFPNTRLWVKGDSLLVSCHQFGFTRHPSELHLWSANLWGYQTYSQLCCTVVCSHIFREGNQPLGWLVMEAVKHNEQ